MQTKSSYRVLKWTFILGAMASLGACVVTSGDGGDDDFNDGGESGSSTTAGKSSSAGTGGSTSTAGKTSSAGTGGSSTTTAGSGAGGEGGDAYVPGVCDDDLKVPSKPRDTALNADDETPAYACRKCLKVSCAEAWSTCYGEEPTSACGYGSTKDSLGQFECIRSCYVTDTSSDDAETVLGNCEGKCLDQCADKDQGFATSDTQELLGCGQDHCLADCFTP